MIFLILAAICLVLFVGCLFGSSYDAKERRERSDAWKRNHR